MGYTFYGMHHVGEPRPCADCHGLKYSKFGNATAKFRMGKRLVKLSKIYFCASAIFGSLSGIHTSGELLTHPKLGASWDGFALEEIL